MAITMKKNPLFKFFISLRLTVVLLSVSLFIIFFGTMAQEPMGLKQAVDRYFKSWFVDQVAMEAGINKTAQLFGAKWEPLTQEKILGHPGIPVFPGGYLIGTLLLINLVTSHYVRFEMSSKKAGIYLTHLGIITLLLGYITNVFVGLTTLVGLFPIIGPLIVKVFTIPFFWFLNGLGYFTSAYAIKTGYGRDIVGHRLITITLLTGIVLGYILGHLIPVR